MYNLPDLARTIQDDRLRAVRHQCRSQAYAAGRATERGGSDSVANLRVRLVPSILRVRRAAQA